MSHRLISGALRKAWIGAAGAVSFALAAPFSAAPGALAGPKPPPQPAHAYNVTLSCATSNGGGYLQSVWRWYQGGASGTLLASGSLSDTCPNMFNGANSVAFAGKQPAHADTLFAAVEINLYGCGNLDAKTISFTPGSPVSLGLSVSATSPCKYAPTVPSTTVDASFALQS